MTNNGHLYAEFFNLTNNALVIIKDQKLIDCNDRIVNLFRYNTKEEMIGQFILILFPEFQPGGKSSVVEFHEILNSISYESTKTVNCVCAKKDSTEFNAELSIGKRVINNETYIFIVMRDISNFTYDKKLLQSEQFKQYLDVSSNYIVALDQDGKINFINKALGSILANNSKYLIGKDWFDIALPSTIKSEVKKIFKEIIKGHIKGNHEVYNQPILTKTGEERIIMWSNSILKDEYGHIIGTLSSGQDITEKIKIEKQLMESEANFRQLVENINEVFWVKNIDNDDMIYISPAYEQLWGEKWTCGSAFDLFYHSVHPDDLVNVQASFNQVISTGKNSKIEFRIIKPSGCMRWIYSRSFPVRDENNKIFRIVGVAEDITERKELQDQLYTMATTDYLTGASNRQHFLKTAESFVAYAKLTKEPISLMMLDIDYFKKINDTYGHSIGDDVLKEFVKSCIDTLGENDLFGRIGGEEFAIFLTGSAEKATFNLAENLRKKIENLKLKINAHTITFTISIGIAMLSHSDDYNNCISNLLNNSDKALYQAKNSGRNKTVIYQKGVVNHS